MIDFIYQPNFLVLFFDTWTIFHAFYCSATAAWIKFSSFGVCFKSVASFFHPQYLLRTSPRFIPCVWMSWIWHFHLNSKLVPRRNVWNLVFATSRPETMKLTCEFRRFLARTLRPVRWTLAKIWMMSTFSIIWMVRGPRDENVLSTGIRSPIRPCNVNLRRRIPRPIDVYPYSP